MHGTCKQVIELAMEVFLLRQRSIEQKLKVLFREGDDNGDGVLSFEEFNRIVSRYVYERVHTVALSKISWGWTYAHLAGQIIDSHFIMWIFQRVYN